MPRATYTGILSGVLTISSGASQCNHLGPLLFILSIHELPPVAQYSWILMYAWMP